MGEFRDKVALVTGGGRGIGRAIALELAQEGCDIAVLARTNKEIEQVASEVRQTGRRGIAVAGDLPDGRAIAQAAASVSQELGPIDILINNAGVVDPFGPTATIDPDKWAESIEINLVAVYRLIRACLPAMLERGWGRIINISTGAATGTGMSLNSAYSASKAGLEMLTLNIAAELTGQGITVNALRPGTVDTAMQTHVRNQPIDRVGQQTHDRFKHLHEQGLLLDPTQPAHLVVKILQSGSTGEVININDARAKELLSH